MAILCIRLKDNLRVGHPAPEKAARRGDIIAVLPDNQHPGRKVLASPNFIAILLKRIPANHLQWLVAPEVDEKSGDTAPIRALRRYRFDLSKLTQKQMGYARGRMLVYDTADDDFTLSNFLDQCIDKTSSKTIRQEGKTL